MKTTLLKFEDYIRSPWKNGGGIFTDIADAHRPGAAVKDWDSLLWRFASTPIVAPGPFSLALVSGLAVLGSIKIVG